MCVVDEKYNGLSSETKNYLELGFRGGCVLHIRDLIQNIGETIYELKTKRPYIIENETVKQS